MAGALIGSHMTHFKPLDPLFFFLSELSGLFPNPPPVTMSLPKFITLDKPL